MAATGGSNDSGSTRNPSGGLEEANKTTRSIPTGPRSTSNIPTGPRGSYERREAPKESTKESVQPQHEETSDSTTAGPAVTVNEPDGPLPDGWTRTLSRTHGKYFYFHEPTGATQWQAPTGPGSDGPITESNAAEQSDQTQSYPSPKSKSPSPDRTAAPAASQSSGKTDGDGLKPTTLTASSSNGTAESSTEQRVPGGPARNQTDIPAAPRGERQNFTTSSARGMFNGRNGRLDRPPAGPAGSGPRDLVRRRSPSPVGRNDVKRPRAEEPRRASPPHSSVSTAPRRDTREDLYPPRSAPIIGSARLVEPPARGANNAPLPSNRWNNKVTSESDTAARRAALADRRKKAEEELKQIQQEEQELDRLVSDEKRKREEEDRLKKEEDDRQSKLKAEDERKRRIDEERDRDRSGRGNPRDDIPRGGLGSDGRGRPGDYDRGRRSPPPLSSRPSSPGRRRVNGGGDSYRPPMSPPRPPGPFHQRIARGPDPFPPRDVPPRRSPPRRPPSPLPIRRDGPGYRDDFRGPLPPRSFAEPMSDHARRATADRDDRRGPPPAMRMQGPPPGRPRSPPPGSYRPLAERMSRPPVDDRRR